MPAQPAALRVPDPVRGDVERDAGAAQRLGYALGADVLRGEPAPRFFLDVRHHFVGERVARPQQPHREHGKARECDTGGQRPLSPGRRPRGAQACDVGRPLQRAADIGIERAHLVAEPGAGRARRQVLLERGRRGERIRADEQPCLVAAHDRLSGAAASGAAVRPQMTRSLLRARNSRVSTAVADSASSRAISSVEKPPTTCRMRGSRY